MFVLNTTRKKVIHEENGLILSNQMGENTVSFYADLPNSAVVDHVKVNGVFLEDIKANVSIRSNMDEYLPMERKGIVLKCAATVDFHGDPPELYGELANNQIEEFEVYYHLEASVDAD